MEGHWHGLHELPGGEVDSSGRAVNLLLIGELTAATLQGCRGCRDRLLDSACRDAVVVVRLVETACLLALRMRDGDLAPHMHQDDHTGPGAAEFRTLAALLHAGGDIHDACTEMTDDQRRTVAATALEYIAGDLLVANVEDGIGSGQSLPEAMVATASLMTTWWAQTAPRHAERLRRRWESAEASSGQADPDAARLAGGDALSLFLGAVLHAQGVRQEITGATLPDLRYADTLPTLSDPADCARVIAEFAWPLGVTEHVSRLRQALRAEGNDDLLSLLAVSARQVVGAHFAYCSDGRKYHRCTLADVAGFLTAPHDAPHWEAQLPPSQRTAHLPSIGFSVEPPVGGPPAGTSADHRWLFPPGRIVLRRFDADVERWNDIQSEDSSLGTPRYESAAGLEVLACSWCAATDHFLAEGAWGDPLLLHCSCGTSTTWPATAAAPEFGVRLLQHLILAEADAAYPARRVDHLLRAYLREAEESAARAWYNGPSTEQMRIAEATDPADTDLAAALAATLAPRLPDRHPGGDFELLLVRSVLALADPAAVDSADGRALAETIRAVLVHLRTQSKRFEPSRRLVIDYLTGWQREGGPEAWQAAWQQTLALVGARVGHASNRHGALRDGCAAVTVALYVLAREQGTRPEEVSVEELREFAARPEGEDGDGVLARWEQRLTALGHHPGSVDDPVARLWQHLRTESSGARSTGAGSPGPALLAGLDTVFDAHSFYLPL
ncbi:hypothetical protein P3T35_000482 [Kitasatospora sp. GP30]|uniref:hypothetical protein n=1 Tax=Kitasatospora sp. GP30 TaxID=3035084 RepID=UPI000C712E28|nr:hypothetical protein [Kitasatospora sp. GP30]MDH6138505.1 hypothetical protein [Kitasatospora sp. GP30]